MMEEYLAELNYVGHHNGIKLALTVIENLKTATSLASVNCTDNLDSCFRFIWHGCIQGNFGTIIIIWPKA